MFLASQLKGHRKILVIISICIYVRFLSALRVCWMYQFKQHCGENAMKSARCTFFRKSISYFCFCFYDIKLRVRFRVDWSLTDLNTTHFPRSEELKKVFEIKPLHKLNETHLAKLCEYIASQGNLYVCLYWLLGDPLYMAWVIGNYTLIPISGI